MVVSRQGFSCSALRKIRARSVTRTHSGGNDQGDGEEGQSRVGLESRIAEQPRRDPRAVVVGEHQPVEFPQVIRSTTYECGIRTSWQRSTRVQEILFVSADELMGFHERLIIPIRSRFNTTGLL